MSHRLSEVEDFELCIRDYEQRLKGEHTESIIVIHMTQEMSNKLVRSFCVMKRFKSNSFVIIGEPL